MEEIRISDAISYIGASDNPLSADIGIIRREDGTWLYDVGNGEKNIAGLDGSYRIVLSHFHADHTGNIGRIRAEAGGITQSPAPERRPHPDNLPACPR